MLRTKRALVAALAALVLSATPALAAIETDPDALYATMKQAYDQALSHQAAYADQSYYFSTVLDAGRAYALFRPTDAQYGEIANLTIDLATRLNYDPLTNNDAAVWYVREASLYVTQHGDAAHGDAAKRVLERLDENADPAFVARRAQADALANAQAFPHDGDALVDLIVADVRAYNLTHDATYRSALLDQATNPQLPLVRIPDPEWPVLLKIAQDMATDSSATPDDRAHAKIILERRAHTPDLQVIGRVRAIPHALHLTRTAPADEYFGNTKLSPLGVRNELIRINKYLDAGWGVRMSGDAINVEQSVDDWHKQYPHDTTLPQHLLDTYHVLERVAAPDTKVAASHVRGILLVEYANSRQARELAAS